MHVSRAFIAVGGNRNPAAADWDARGLGLLYFGADNSIALWDPREVSGVQALLNGHTKAVNAVKFFPGGDAAARVLISGSADHTVRIWCRRGHETKGFECVKVLTEHSNAVTRIAVLPDSDIFATGASDGTVKIWKLVHSADFSIIEAELRQTILLSPKYFPLSIALAKLDESSVILAVAGTLSAVQIFTSKDSQFTLSATLTGHEGWIRALDFAREKSDQPSDLLLASASQDKYIRLWRVHKGDELPAASTSLSDSALGSIGKSLSNKAHWISTATSKHSITFEALLLGHEDWIYQASWRHREGKLQLLSTSEDNSLSIWESDPSSGVWVCITRLGEISAQKGSTSATGSAGGFWTGLWSPDGNSVVSLGRTGSWRQWNYSAAEDIWTQQVAITGHVREVKGVCWSKDGSYLLTTSSDQTTRLFSQWKSGTQSPSWHEFSRPQIHGYDLNCISAITNTQFISGADEKLLRVFDEPKGVAQMLDLLCHIKNTTTTELPDAANIPVLGLSNKAIQAVDDNEVVQAENANNEDEEEQPIDPSSVIKKSALELKTPPFEDHLARHLLWPETEKLYGHGFEISAVAVSYKADLVATTCRASSIDHALIRLYDTTSWLEIKPPLKAHSLTVTALCFSPDDQYLLSVGRDRQWVVWQRSSTVAEEERVEGKEKEMYVLKHSDPKGHSRMILDVSWAPLQQPTFLTAGRDKSVKMWQITPSNADNQDGETTVQLKATITTTSPVTVVSCNPVLSPQGSVLFAFGTENGDLSIARVKDGEWDKVESMLVAKDISPAKTVTSIAWRPGRSGGEGMQVAVGSEDSAVRMFSVQGVE